MLTNSEKIENVQNSEIAAENKSGKNHHIKGSTPKINQRRNKKWGHISKTAIRRSATHLEKGKVKRMEEDKFNELVKGNINGLGKGKVNEVFKINSGTIDGTVEGTVDGTIDGIADGIISGTTDGTLDGGSDVEKTEIVETVDGAISKDMEGTLDVNRRKAQFKEHLQKWCKEDTVKVKNDKLSGKCDIEKKEENGFEISWDELLEEDTLTAGEGESKCKHIKDEGNADEAHEDNMQQLGVANIHKKEYEEEDGTENREDNDHETRIYDYETEVEDRDDDSMPGLINRVEPETTDDSSNEEENMSCKEVTGKEQLKKSVEVIQGRNTENGNQAIRKEEHDHMKKSEEWRQDKMSEVPKKIGTSNWDIVMMKNTSEVENDNDPIPELVNCKDWMNDSSITSDEEDEEDTLIHIDKWKLKKKYNKMDEMATVERSLSKDNRLLSRSCDSQWGGCYRSSNNILHNLVYVLCTLFVCIALTTSTTSNTIPDQEIQTLRTSSKEVGCQVGTAVGMLVTVGERRTQTERRSGRPRTLQRSVLGRTHEGSHEGSVVGVTDGACAHEGSEVGVTDGACAHEGLTVERAYVRMRAIQE